MEVLEVGFLHGDVVGQSSGTHIQTCCIDCLDIHIVTIDMVVELPFLGFVIINGIEEVGIEVGPLLEGKLLPEESRCHVTGNEGCLDE